MRLVTGVLIRVASPSRQTGYTLRTILALPEPDRAAAGIGKSVGVGGGNLVEVFLDRCT